MREMEHKSLNQNMTLLVELTELCFKIIFAAFMFSGITDNDIWSYNCQVVSRAAQQFM